MRAVQACRAPSDVLISRGRVVQAVSPINVQGCGDVVQERTSCADVHARELPHEYACMWRVCVCDCPYAYCVAWVLHKGPAEALDKGL